MSTPPLAHAGWWNESGEIPLTLEELPLPTYCEAPDPVLEIETGAPAEEEVTDATEVLATMRNPTRSRGWCFTWNNPTLTGDALNTRLLAQSAIEYYVFQKESGERATQHFQGYVHYKNSRVMPLRLLPGNPHWEKARGTPQQNHDYCTKMETRIEGPWEHGEMPKQGKRTDLEATAARIIAGSTMHDIALSDPVTFIENSSGICRLFRTLGQASHPTHIQRHNFLFYGPTRTGKSYHARECEPLAYIKLPDQWWDGYNGEDAVIWDDFSAGWSITLVRLLQLTDNYYTRVEIKGGFEHFAATTNIFTTNIHPSQWYNYTARAEQQRALGKRFEGVYIYGPNGIEEALEERDLIDNFWVNNPPCLDGTRAHRYFDHYRDNRARWAGGTHDEYD